MSISSSIHGCQGGCYGLENDVCAYPQITDDVGILRLRSDKGNALFPEWKNYPLTKHGECKGRCKNGEATLA